MTEAALVRETLEADDDLDLQEWFRGAELTDGLPIMVPTVERVEHFIEVSGFRRDLEVGPIDPGGGIATVENVAVNAVMAGCRPEHLGVVLTALDAMRDPRFNLAGVQPTTNPVAPLAIVNGPVRHELGIDSGGHALGPGRHANGPIGRAIRFVMRNIGECIGEDDRATLGLPAKYTFCLAENEEASPWEPLHVSLGYERGDDVVTMVGPESIIDCCAVWTTAEPILEQFTRLMKAVGTNLNFSMGTLLWVINPSHARMIADAGYDRQKLKERLFEDASFAESDWPHGNWEVGDWVVENGRVKVTKSPDDIYIIVAGRDDPLHSTYMPPMTFSEAVSTRVWRPGA